MAPAPRSLPKCDQPGPRPDIGFSTLSFQVRSTLGGPAHSTRGARTMRCTPAPLSWSRAAVSSADWPAPTTATSEPANFDRSSCCDVCDTSDVGRGSPSASEARTGGRFVNCTWPAAITTERVVKISPVPSSTSKRSPAALTRTTRSCSIGTSCSWNQQP